ncbi:MAG: 16S rRNA (guanine(966)-N(2))-methyltransferase RsmD [bacterium]|nr:16S rRNA (guanine(966)-N(2))-methyltransferase RsmD [bacterium]
MKIIGGSNRRKKITGPQSRKTRPPLSRVREALFDILQTRIPGAAVLDLFAGTGSYSLEALSRGAKEADLVEIDQKATRVIQENLKRTGLEKKARIYQGDVLKVVEQLENEGKRYDIIIIAPPYFKDLGNLTLKAIDHLDILNKDGSIMVQHHKKEEIISQTDRFALIKEYGYGATHLSKFAYRREGEKS